MDAIKISSESVASCVRVGLPWSSRQPVYLKNYYFPINEHSGIFLHDHCCEGQKSKLKLVTGLRKTHTHNQIFSRE